MEAVAKWVGPRSGEIWCGVHFLIFSVYDHPVFWRSLRFCLKSCKIQDENELAPHFADNCCEADHIRKEQAAVSQVTKRALEQSLKNLLLKKPLTKITINDIAEDCGINRMTFYYHFKDIYDLVDWILAEDAAKAMEGRRGFGTWSEAYLDVLHQLQDNKTLVLNVYRSVGREQVEQYLYRLLDPILKDFADRECHDITVQDADKQFVVDFYKYALVGMTLEWTRRDMKGDPKKMVERVSTMIHGDFRRALCRLSTGSLKIEE